MSMSDPNPTVESIHYWKSANPISPDTQSEAEDKLNEVLAGDVIVTVHGVLWEAPTAVLPEAAVDSVHDLADLDENDTTYRCAN